MGLVQGKLALVTGAGKGLGAAIAKGLAREGATVVVADMDEPAALATVREIQSTGGAAHSFAFDVRVAADVVQVAARVGEQLGAIDILVNNAGMSVKGRFDDADSPDVWARVMQVNLQGTFNVSHAFVGALKKTQGAIINLCSIVAFGSGISSVGYVVSKGGVRSLTQVMARDLAPYGVRVNAVAPGLMETDMTAGQRATPHGTDWYCSRTPMARNGTPEEIVGPVIFLASSMASYVNGVILPVDGGYLAV
ncbi:SDR family NAD(P)-dependent oxidoreductase [Paralcaligenes ureilyticus]|uniref:NAD(P)-dependent dehydrogenase (Short-subunit alcohol dehydrogenase family) n=1 Tax=Paralcaligenes ureilyticus TaxID=627131 RepID=A0A4R3M3L1_9BURK|nr:SDR family oxidoreductase [Paralcaligenes ureilyticus]TCT07366.1 NAD(P)-dependent dehydrogenase (short-subunit alcohol dehydrogenase family) [Paralcaligenes ureilyticus]